MMTDTTLPGGLHRDFILQRLPQWVKYSSGKDLQRLRATQVDAQYAPAAPAALAQWFTRAPLAQQQVLLDCQTKLRRARRGLAGLLKHLKGITDFAEPLLKARLKADLGIDVDVNTAQLVRITRTWAFNGRWQQITDQRQSLLQAALQNFAASATFGDDDYLSIDGEYTVRNEVIREPALLTVTQPLGVTPQAFARLCHELDLGGLYQKHLAEVFDTPFTHARIRERWIEVYKAMLQVSLHTAYLKAEISTAARDALTSLLDGHSAPQYQGHPLEVSQLSMYGVNLEDVWVISARHASASAAQPVIVYLPGAPLYPLKEYASIEAFKADLRISLSQPAYFQLLTSYVAKAQQPAFAQTLREHFYHKVVGASDAFEVVYNPQGRLVTRSRPLTGDMFRTLQAQHAERLKTDAKAVIVPSGEYDLRASQARWAFWESAGENVFGVAALFIPVVGEVMLAVMAEQLLMQVIETGEDWSNGDYDSAWAHVGALAQTIAVTAALVPVGVAIQAGSSLVLDELLQVNLAVGGSRLWRANLAPYARSVELSEVLPDAQGLYTVGEKRYVRIDDHVCEVAHNEHGQWRVTSDVPGAYEPPVRSNGEGAWRADGERPLTWDRRQLLRRLGHATAGLKDAELAEAADLCGISDDVLRKVHMDRTRMPALLADTLRRLRLDRQVTRFIDATREGAGLGKDLGFLPALAVQLPRWPGRVIEVFSGPEPWGESITYGRELYPQGPVIKLTRDEVYGGQLPERILGSLDEASAAALVGESVAPGKRLQVLRDHLADHAALQRSKVFDSLYDSQRPARNVAVQRIQRQFSNLPDEAANTLLARASGAEYRELSKADGRVPLRVAEEARVYQREARINRALQGLYQPSLAGVDSDRLALGLLDRLPGWTAEVRLELREESLGGRLAGSVGGPDALLKTLVRQVGQYRLYDHEGLELGIASTLHEGMLKALPDNERLAMGYTVHEGGRLLSALRALAVTDRAVVADLLGIRPVRPWFIPPFHLADKRVGYPLGGVVSHARSPSSRLRDLYPNMTREQREALIRVLQAQGDLETSVKALQQEYEALYDTLDDWFGLAVDAEDDQEILSRSAISDRLKECWRAEGSHVLDLSGLVVSALPTLAVRFEHIEVLTLDSMDLHALPPGFLSAFPSIRRLSLDFNVLTAIPPAISDCTALRELSFNANHITGGAQSFVPLRGLSQLQRLNLGANALEALNLQALQDLSGLGSLRELSLRGNFLSLTARGVEALARLSLRELDLGYNLISLDEAAAQAFAPMVHLERIVLTNNPLGRPPALGGMSALRHVDLGDCRIAAWPEALTVLMNREPLNLRVVELSRNRIESLPDLSTTRFGQALLSGDASLHLDVNANPLQPGALQRMAQLGHNLVEEDMLDVSTVWLEGVAPTRQTLWHTLKQDPAFRTVFDVLDRLGYSREAELDQAGVRERIWSVLEFAEQHQAFREELLEIADSYPATCADMSADAFSDFEIARLVFDKALAAGTDEVRSRGMFNLYKQLFRRSEVNRMADLVSLRRTARRAALQSGGEVPALDRLDDISDATLLAHTVDDIEIRLKLRQSLAAKLDYPEPSSGMQFSHLAEVSERLRSNVRKAVRSNDTVQARQDWLVRQTSWRYYLRQRYGAQFKIVEALWDEGMTYLEECTSDEALSVQALGPTVIEALGTAFPQAVHDADGNLHKVTLSNAQYLDAANTIMRGREASAEQLISSLTRSQGLLQ